MKLLLLLSLNQYTPLLEGQDHELFFFKQKQHV